MPSVEIFLIETQVTSRQRIRAKHRYVAEPAVILERDQHILTITLNRPEKRNAFNPEVLCRLADAWDLLDDDPELRVAIMTGADGNFSAGADLDRLVGALIAGEPPQNEYEERVRSDFSLMYKGFLKDHHVKKPRSRVTAMPAAWRSCRRSTSGWPPRTHSWRSAKCSAVCFR